MGSIHLPGWLQSFESISGTAISIVGITIAALYLSGFMSPLLTQADADTMHVEMNAIRVASDVAQKEYLDRKFKIQEYTTQETQLGEIIWNVERAIIQDTAEGRDTASDEDLLKQLQNREKAIITKLADCKNPALPCD